MNVIEDVRRPSEYGVRGESPPITATQQAEMAGRLSRLAHLKVTTALKGFGNAICPTHDQALRELAEALTNQCFHVRPGRYAYALPCGAGKTQSVVAWIAAAHELGLKFSIAVSAFQIDALCSIKDDLMSAGVPESLVGLRHSLGSKARLADTGQDDRPIMLISHARIRGASDFPIFCMHRGKKRDLLIWDESLLTADAETLSSLDVAASIERILPELPKTSRLAAGLMEARSMMNAEVEAQSAGFTPKPVLLIRDAELGAMQDEVKRLRAYGSLPRVAAIKTLKSFVKLASRPVAIALTGSGAAGDGLIRYTIAVDADLSNIAILDASYPIRKLTHSDGLNDGTTPAMRSCKTYDRVKVRQVFSAVAATKTPKCPAACASRTTLELPV